MNLSPFKQDIDELLDEFDEAGSTTLADMKRVWKSRKFSYIFDASPSTNLAFFMQSLYGHTIAHMVSAISLSRRLASLYCLYCLHETQPFKPPFRIYVSLGELEKLRGLVAEAKEKNIKGVAAVVSRMLEKNMFLFGSVDLNESSTADTVNQLTELQNRRVEVACEKLFANTEIEDFLHMDIAMEVDLNVLKKMSTEYGEAKRLAVEEASGMVDVQNMKQLSEDSGLIERVGDMVEDWNNQKQKFYHQTGTTNLPANESRQQQPSLPQEEDGFGELEQLLLQI